MRKFIAILALFIAPVCYGQSQIGGGSGTSSGNLSANTATRAVYATDPQWAGGVKGGAVYVCDGTWSNSSSTITQNNTAGFTDPAFTSAVVGDVIWGSDGGACQANAPTNTRIPLGVILSVNNANSIQVSTTTTAACSSASVAQCTIVYGKYDDTAALQAAWNQANTICGVLILPSANMIVSGASTESQPFSRTNRPVHDSLAVTKDEAPWLNRRQVSHVRLAPA